MVCVCRMSISYLIGCSWCRKKSNWLCFYQDSFWGLSNNFAGPDVGSIRFIARPNLNLGRACACFSPLNNAKGGGLALAEVAIPPVQVFFEPVNA